MELLHGTPLELDGLTGLYAWPSDAGASGPYVRANMVSSFDGATAFDGQARGISTSNDFALLLALRELADVVLVGAETVRAEGYGPVRSAAGGRAAPLAIVTGSLRGLHPTDRVFTEAAQRTILVTTSRADTSAFADVADVLVAGEDRVAWPEALAGLAERGLTRVLTEGGPSIIGQLAIGEHIDEVCLALSPLLVSGNAKRMSDGPPLADPQRYRLVHAVSDEGLLFLRYVRASRSA